METAYLLTTASVRIDLLLVFHIAGSSDAGVYSIALTLATVVGLAPFAISYASFPRLTDLAEEHIGFSAASLARLGITASVTLAVMLAAVAPLAIPVLFGSAFSAAVVPTLLLLIGSVIASYQWILARALAAVGRTQLMLTSYAAGLLTMLVGDVILISALGLEGAALASILGSAVGTGVCLWRFAALPDFRLRFLVPGLADVKRLFSFTTAALADLKRALFRPSSDGASC